MSILLTVFALSLRGQQAQTNPKQPEQKPPAVQPVNPSMKPGEKLKGVIQWDPHTGQVSWVTQKVILDMTDPENPVIVLSGDESGFAIDLKTAIMSKRAGESTEPTEFRRFSPKERDAVKDFMGKLTEYCLNSSLWWDEHQGTPVDKEGKPLREDSPAPQTPAIKDDSLSIAFLRPSIE